MPATLARLLLCHLWKLYCTPWATSLCNEVNSRYTHEWIDYDYNMFGRYCTGNMMEIDDTITMQELRKHVGDK